MAKLQFTKEDLLQGVIVRPDWYPIEIMKVDEKPKKEEDDGSINVFVLAKILSGEFAGVQIYGFLFNTKAPVFARNFTAAMLGIQPKELTPGTDFEINEHTCVGKRADLYVGNDEYQGRPQNKMLDWAILGAMTNESA